MLDLSKEVGRRIIVPFRIHDGDSSASIMSKVGWLVVLGLTAL